MKNVITMLLSLLATLTAAGQDAASSPIDVEVTFSKTLHILFPTTVRYVDLGSTDLIADKADGADNVVRVKAAKRGFTGETNFSVITSDGVFYTFNAVYADNPQRMSLRMADRLREDPFAPAAERQAYTLPAELEGRTPLEVSRAMYSIYNDPRQYIKTIGSKSCGIEMLLRGVYVQQGLFYFDISIRNYSKVTFDVSQLRFRITDRRAARRTPQQDIFINPVRTYNTLDAVLSKQTARNIYVFAKFPLPADKAFVVELIEKGDARSQSFAISERDLRFARTIAELNTDEPCDAQQ